VTKWSDVSREEGCGEQAACPMAHCPEHVGAHAACARAARGASDGPTRAFPVRDYQAARESRAEVSPLSQQRIMSGLPASGKSRWPLVFRSPLTGGTDLPFPDSGDPPQGCSCSAASLSRGLCVTAGAGSARIGDTTRQRSAWPCSRTCKSWGYHRREALVRIKRLVLAQRVIFTAKAESEMCTDGLSHEAVFVFEAIINAPAITKTLRSRNPRSGQRETL
jgi:hypothetical protein